MRKDSEFKNKTAIITESLILCMANSYFDVLGKIRISPGIKKSLNSIFDFTKMMYLCTPF